MKRVIAMLLAIMLLFSSTGEILASEIANTRGISELETELEWKTGLQEVEAIAIPESEQTEEILDYRELAEVSMFSAVYGNEWDKYSTNYYYNQLSPEWKEFWDAMDVVCASYLTGSDDITNAQLQAVSTPSGITGDELKMLWSLFMYSNPQYYFLLNSYSYSYWTSQDLPTSIILMSYDAFCSGSARATATAAIKTQIAAWEAELENCTKDEEKVKKIFDLICKKVTYNDAVLEGDNSITASEEQACFSQSIYSVLCTDTTVCAGYADTMTLMCNGAGIDAVSVTSPGHQWNKIRINDSWYNYDATWGDQNKGIYYEYYARNDESYVNDGSSHVEEDFWEMYSPKATLDTAPSSPWVAPGTYPAIVNKAATPKITITESDGTYLVIITSDTADADIYYTLDGTEPSVAFTKSIKYTQSFTTSTAPQVKAIAVKDTYWDSDVASGAGEEHPDVPEIHTYTIIYKLDGGINHANNLDTYQSNANAFTLYEPSKEGYTFEGWYYDSSFTNPVTTISGNSGNITVYAKWSKNYISIANASVTMDREYFIYDGSEQRPEVTVRLNGEKLILNTDYSVSYKDNVNAGTATVTITGIGEYSGTIIKDYTIAPLSLAGATITLLETDFTYDGKEHTPEIIVQLNNVVLEKGVDYEISYTNHIAVGTATVTITGIGNYTDSTYQLYYIHNVPEAITCSVGFFANGGENLSETLRYVEENSSVGALPTVERDGYTFKGWYTASTGGTKITADTIITGNTSFYAQWEKQAVSLASATITLDKTRFVYDGTAKEPSITVKLNNATLSKEIDYTVTYENNKAAGTATVMIRGIGNYKDTASTTFEILKAPLTIKAGNVKKEYGQNNPTYTWNITSGQLAAGDTLTDITANRATGENVGTYAISLSQANGSNPNYAITFESGSLEITPKEVGIIWGNAEFVYNGNVQMPTATATGVLKNDICTLTVTGGQANVGGNYTAQITKISNPNYKLPQSGLTKVFSIKPATISESNVTLSKVSYVYDGTAKQPTVTVKLGNKTLIFGTDYTVSYASNTTVGTATVTISGKGNYGGTASKAYTITAASIQDAKVTLSATSYDYDGKAKEPSVTVMVGDKKLGKDDYSVSYKNNKNIGTATVTITGVGNYCESISTTFTINKADISKADVTLSAVSFLYDGTAKQPSTVVKLGNKTLLSGTDYTVSYADNIAVGTATVTITGKGNYTGTVNKTFTIGISSIEGADVTLSETSYVYDGTAKQPTITVKLDNKILVSGNDYTVNYTNNTTVGTATVTITGKGNYAGTISKTYTITVASIQDAKVTLSATSYDYDGKVKEPSVTVMLGNKTLTKDDYFVSYKNNINIGTATVTITGKGNYTGTITQTFTIKLDKGDAFTSGKYKYKVTGSSSVAFNGIASTKTTKVSIPKTVTYGGKTFKVTSVADKALKGKTKVTQITIGANVTKIGASAFAGCTKLSKVTMGTNVTSIGSSAFKGCTKLTKISMGKKVKTVGVSAFENCKKLSNVTIGSAVTTIDDKAFKNCTALKSITIPSKVTKIDKQAFYGCKNLKTITIKSTKLKTVGKEAFKKINSKATIKVPKSKLKSYQKLLKGKGQGSKVKIVK